MIKSVSILLLFLSFNCKEEYLNAVLGSRLKNQYYLVVKVKDEKSQKEILVLNYDLYTYLKSLDNNYNDSAYYSQQIKNKITHGDAINIGGGKLSNLSYLEIVNDALVDSIAMKGKDYFIKYFFYVSAEKTYARFKIKNYHANISKIFKVLFDWNYFICTVENNYEIINLNICKNYSN